MKQTYFPKCVPQKGGIPPSIPIGWKPRSAGSTDFRGSQIFYTDSDKVEEENKKNMEIVYETDVIPQVSTPTKGGSLTVDSDRVKAPVVGACSKDFEGSHIHYPMTKEIFEWLNAGIEPLVESILEKENIHTGIKRKALKYH